MSTTPKKYSYKKVIKKDIVNIFFLYQRRKSLCVLLLLNV